jgi:hypothetical protein
VSSAIPLRGEPTASALAAIDAEWPLIEAELALTDAEITQTTHPSALNRTRVRLAEARVTRVAAELATRPVILRAVA